MCQVYQSTWGRWLRLKEFSVCCDVTWMFTLRSWPGHPSSWATFIPLHLHLSRNRPKNKLKLLQIIVVFLSLSYIHNETYKKGKGEAKLGSYWQHSQFLLLIIIIRRTERKINFRSWGGWKKQRSDLKDTHKLLLKKEVRGRLDMIYVHACGLFRRFFSKPR